MMYSINDKVLGAGEPIRVKPGERVLMHLLNASAIENKRIALPGHRFQVLALDGNPVPSPQFAEAVMLGPGERVDAMVEMNQPGVWILGGTDDMARFSVALEGPQGLRPTRRSTWSSRKSRAGRGSLICGW
jgi:FtsP/CotA-like multicopper oxidase with cupredoxin domain